MHKNTTMYTNTFLGFGFLLISMLLLPSKLFFLPAGNAAAFSLPA